MIRSLIPALLSGVLLLSAAPADAQRWYPPPPPRGGWDESLEGNYTNTSNGGQTSVSRRGRGYVFVNENGNSARFVFAGPGRLEMVAGEWNPATVATITRDRQGRRAIRFQEPGNPPGYWVSND